MPTVYGNPKEKERVTMAEVLALLGTTLALAAVIAAWPVMSYFEARAYERVTGKRVSTWDAMFLDLRVQEGAK